MSFLIIHLNCLFDIFLVLYLNSLEQSGDDQHRHMYKILVLVGHLYVDESEKLTKVILAERDQDTYAVQAIII